MNPISWKECHVDGIAPLVILRRVPRPVGVGVVLVLTLMASAGLVLADLPPDVTMGDLLQMAIRGDLAGLRDVYDASQPSPEGFFIMSMVALLAATLIVGIRCSGAISSERERQTWEALLVTPLEPRQLIRGKLRGILHAAVPYLAAYAGPAVLLSVLGGPVAFVWTMLWLAVTGLAMYYIGAAGLWCSGRARSSWRSLLGTLAFGYVGGFLIYALCTVPGMILAILCLLLIEFIGEALGLDLNTWTWLNAYFMTFFLATGLALAGAVFLFSRIFLNSAERRLAFLERTRHWDPEPILRPRRRTLSRPSSYH